jgi:hypothetical protein
MAGIVTALSGVAVAGSIGWTLFKLITKNDLESQIISNANTVSAYSDPADTKLNPHTISYDFNLPVTQVDTGPYGLPRLYYNDPSGTNATILTYGAASHNKLTQA